MLKKNNNQRHYHHKKKQASPLACSCILMIIAIALFIAGFSEGESEGVVVFIVGGVICLVISLGLCISGLNEDKNKKYESNDQYYDQFHNNSPHIVYVETQPQQKPYQQPLMDNQQYCYQAPQPQYHSNYFVQIDQRPKTQKRGISPYSNRQRTPEILPNRQEKQSENALLNFLLPKQRSHSPAKRSRKPPQSQSTNIVDLFKKKQPSKTQPRSQPKPQPRPQPRPQLRKK